LFEINQKKKKKIKQQIGSTSQSTSSKLKEYVDQLYITYTGKLGHPSNTNFLVSSLANKSYSYTQAEYFVKLSKEAREFEKKKKIQAEQEKNAKIREYIQELFRVYLKQQQVSEEEITQYVDPLLKGETTLQSIEDEFKLMSISVPPR